MLVPAPVQSLLNRLNNAGFSAHAVGGCVRDSLMGLTPHDWDICTSARPEDMKKVFAGEHLLETGIKHGTLTVVLNHIPYEITTYRLDGSYTDHRHPDSVSFVDDLREDLSRRDFTINAMACDTEGRITDLFGGQEDIRNRLIRCVGDPLRRFEEDALRVLRALRFSSVLDFPVEADTDRAVRSQYQSLSRVAPERIREELVRLLCGAGAGRVLRDYPEVITFLIPALGPSVGYNQDNPHHLYTVWEHTIRAIENVPAEPLYRLVMLLHDSGKPFTRTTDSNGIGHYKGHQKVSAMLAGDTLAALKFDRATTERVVKLVEAHDIPLSTERKRMLRLLNRYGEEDLRALFIIHRADRIATGTRNPFHAEEHREELSAALDALLAEKPCFTLKDLAVNGRDVNDLGIKGPATGETLRHLLNQVIDGVIPNEKEALLQEARRAFLS